MGGNRPGSEHRHSAEDEGRAHADGDQREHVQVKRHDGAPAALEERPTRPADHGRGERELNPARRIAHHPGIGGRSRESGAPSRGQIPATPARRRSRSASSCRAVRRSPRHPRPRSPSSVPAPCRTWGNRRDDPAALPGASGRCKWSCPLSVPPTPDYVPAPSRISGNHPVCPTPRPDTSGNSIWRQQPASPLHVRGYYENDRGVRGRDHRHPASRRACGHPLGQSRFGTETFSGSVRCKSRTSLRRVQRGAPSLGPPSFRRWGLWSWLSLSSSPGGSHRC